MVVVALMALIGVAGLVIDLGATAIECQRCQNIADAAALSGAQELPYPALVTNVAEETARANLRPVDENITTVSVTCYARDEEIPGVGPAPFAGAVKVVVAKPVKFYFLPLLGVRGTTVQRSAVAAKTIPGTCIAPMWITDTTEVQYGEQINLLMADGPHCGIPGSFGFLQSAGGVDFGAALGGQLAPEEEDLQRVQVGDYVYANTGLAIGQWRGVLLDRIARASEPPWNNDTFDNFLTNNPRLLMVPFVQYVEGTGSGAYFRITRFGAFWLEDVVIDGDDRYIVGRFIDYMWPGGVGYRIKATHLLQ